MASYDVALSAASRQNLLSLQDTASLASINQTRLSTGKKINSALDNPVNFFTAQGLNDRSTALSGLLDGISNSIQTIQAASAGTSKITDLVKSLQSTITQAQADSAANRPTVTGTALSTAAEAKATGLSIRDTTLAKTLGTSAVAASDTATGSVNVGTGPAIALTLTDGENTFTKALTATSTVRDVVDAINASGIASASVDDAGKLTVTGTSDSLKVGLGQGTDAATAFTDAAAGTSNGALGLTAASATTTLPSGKTSATRTNLVTQFNSIRDQIDQIAKDSGFNGTNLLGGDNLTTVFNEKTGGSQSKLVVSGSKVTSDSLGVAKAVNGSTSDPSEFNIQTDKALSSMQDTIKSALNNIKSIQSGLGSNLSVVQTRQDFTKQLATVLSTGASNLTDADMNAEAANSQAITTRQSLSISALSLASQASQGILQLLR
jgi:flagellin